MKRILRGFVFAFLAWLIPFATSICLFPLKRNSPPLFDSLMGVILVLSTVVLACMYLRATSSRFLAAGIRIGILWTLANWGFDGLMFSNGPMKMNFDQYIVGIGIGYLMIPAITIALGVAAQMGSLAWQCPDLTGFNCISMLKGGIEQTNPRKIFIFVRNKSLLSLYCVWDVKVRRSDGDIYRGARD